MAKARLRVRAVAHGLTIMRCLCVLLALLAGVLVAPAAPAAAADAADAHPMDIVVSQVPWLNSNGELKGTRLMLSREHDGIRMTELRGWWSVDDQHPRLVAVPGAPGLRIDERALGDLRTLLDHYRVRVTAAYSNKPSLRSGHPSGVAVDLVPDRRRGGTWDDLRLVERYAEAAGMFPRVDGVHPGRHLHLQ